MEQFSLDKWLEDKSRKVVTRNGRPVRIVCWDKENASSPIVFLIKDSEQDCSYEYINCANIEGKADSGLGSDDLFFADEEEELTEFEQELRYWIGQSLCHYENNGCISDNMSDSVNIYLEAASKKLLGLARKEISKDNVIVTLSEWETLTEKFKDSLKWKKIIKREQNYLAYGYLSHDGYYLSIQELKDKLPKEE